MTCLFVCMYVCVCVCIYPALPSHILRSRESKQVSTVPEESENGQREGYGVDWVEGSGARGRKPLKSMVFNRSFTRISMKSLLVLASLRIADRDTFNFGDVIINSGLALYGIWCRGWRISSI